MKRFYKHIAIFMVCITLSTSIFASADIKVNAASIPIVPALSNEVFVNWVIAVLAACGIVVTADFVMENMTADEFVISFLTGGTKVVDKYGAVDFSDMESVMDFSAFMEEHDVFNTNVKSAAFIDAASYKATGTSATASLDQVLTDFNAYAKNKGSAAMQASYEKGFTVIQGGASGNNNREPFGEMFGWLLTGIVALSVGEAMMEAEETGGYSSFYDFDYPETTEFQDYDFAKYPVTSPYYNGTVPVSVGANSYSLDGIIDKTIPGDYPVILGSGYTDLPTSGQSWAFSSYPVDSSGSIVPHYYVVVGTSHQNIFSNYCTYLYPANTSIPYSSYQFLCFRENGMYSGSYTDIYQIALIDGEWVSYSKKTMNGFFPIIGDNAFWNFNLPMFNSFDDAMDWFNSGALDNSNILNYGQPSSYSDFKTNVGSSANKDALDSFQTFLSMEPTVDDVVSLGTNISNIPSVGTNSALPDIEAAIDDSAAALPQPEPDIETYPEYVPDANPNTSTDVETETEVDPETGQVLYTGILGKILNGILAIARSIWNFFQNPIEYIATGIGALNNGLLRIIEIIPGQLGDVLGNIVLLPQSIFELFSNPLQGIQNAISGLWTNVEPYLQNFRDALQGLLPDPEFDLQPDTPGDGTDSGTNTGFKFTMLLDGLIVLILILLMLLSIFLHCLEFIINVFKIPATPGFLPEDMVTGFNYIKTLEIPGIGMSVYDFLMGLVYILLVFGVIGVMRKNIDRIRLDR